MIVRTSRLARFAALLLVPALLAAAPSAQFCPLTAEQLRAVSFTPCLLLGMPPAGAMPADDASTRGVSTGECTATGCDPTACPFGHAQASSCDHATPAAPTRAPHPARLCIGDPAGGQALRASTPRLASPAPLLAVLATAPSIAPSAVPAQTRWPELGARAPTHRVAARPPARAPPATS